MFEYLEKEEILELLEKHPHDCNVVIDERIVGGRQLIDTIEEGVHRVYENDNWDGLNDVICALDAIEDQTVRIVHLGLPVLKDLDMSIYLDVLRIACDRWNDPEGLSYRKERNMDVHFYFAKELEAQVEFYLAKEKELRRGGNKKTPFYRSDSFIIGVALLIFAVLWLLRKTS